MEKIDWANLAFGYIPTDYNVRCYYRYARSVVINTFLVQL